MTRLFLWKPTTFSQVVGSGLMPDFGHVAMEVVIEATGQSAYISFWPEEQSLIGLATNVFKHRATRNPLSYTAEIDPAGGYMQRPADEIETLEGLDEPRILQEWEQTKDSGYHVRTWNCSNVSKFLMISTMSPEDYARVESQASCSVEDLQHIRDNEDLHEKLRYLTTSAFIDCRPEDVLRLARAYNGKTDAEPPTLTPKDIEKAEETVEAAAQALAIRAND